MGSLLDAFRQPPRVWLLNLLCWCGGGTLLVASTYWVVYGGEFPERMGRSAALMAGYALMAPPVFRWGASWEWSSEDRLRRVFQALLILAVFILVHTVLYAGLRAAMGLTRHWSGRELGLLDMMERFFPRGALMDVPVFIGILSVAQTAVYRRRLREREVDAAELRRQLLEARLAALQMQLQPHFLFNTLNTVGALARRDPEAANRVLALMGDLLRRTLDSSETQEVTLREELDVLEPYLEIQRTRFRDRLSVTLDVAPETLDCRVPTLILQPLVENAVRHGIEAQPGQGEVRVRAARRDGRLELEVADDGPGIDASAARGDRGGEGVGLANTRERLTRLYGHDQELSLEPRRSGGVRVVVRLPFRTGARTGDAP